MKEWIKTRSPWFWVVVAGEVFLVGTLSWSSVGGSWAANAVLVLTALLNGMAFRGALQTSRQTYAVCRACDYKTPMSHMGDPSRAFRRLYDHVRETHQPDASPEYPDWMR